MANPLTTTNPPLDLDGIDPEKVTIEEMIALLRAARDEARLAGGSVDLTSAERREARILADSLSDEIERLVNVSLASRSKLYDDAAKMIGDLAEPLRKAREDIQKIVRSIAQTRVALRILDKLIGVANRFA